MTENYIFYCDESGNSGENNLDPDQPFYVSAGYLLPDSAVVDVSVALEEIRTQSSGAPELKAKTIFRKPTGGAKALEIMRAVGAKRGIPLFAVAEKRFCIAANVIETFLDPLHNDVLAHAFTGDHETKQELANAVLATAKPETLDAFAEAYRHSKAELVERALDVLCSDTAELYSEEVADLLRGARGHLPAIVEELQTQRDARGGSVNIPTTVSLFQMLERLSRASGRGISSFVHDETATFEERLRSVYETQRAFPLRGLRFPDGRIVAECLASIGRFEFQKSHECLPLQAADVLAGALGRCFKWIRAGAEDGAFDEELARLLLIPLFVPDEETPTLAWALASERLLYSAAAAIGLVPPNAPAPTPLSCAEVFPRKGLSTRGAGDKPRHAWPEETWALLDTGTPLVLKAVTRPARAGPGRVEGLPSTGLDGKFVLPLFSFRDACVAFAQRHYPDAGLVSVRLDTGSDPLDALVRKIEEVEGTASVIVHDPTEDRAWTCSLLDEELSKLRAMHSRLSRAARSGLLGSLFQVVRQDGVDYETVLLSSGKYGARARGHVAFHQADTRAEAVREAAKGREE